MTIVAAFGHLVSATTVVISSVGKVIVIAGILLSIIATLGSRIYVRVMTWHDEMTVVLLDGHC